MLRRLIAAIAAAALIGSAAFAADSTQTVTFPPGSPFAQDSGIIQGWDVVNYRIRAEAG